MDKKYVFEVGSEYVVTKSEGGIIITFTFIGGEPPMVEVKGETLLLSELLNHHIKVEKK